MEDEPAGSSHESSSSTTSSASTHLTSPSVDGENDVKGEDDEDMLDAPSIPDEQTILANKRASPLFARLFRSKGEFFLATRPTRAGDWSQAGAMLTMQGGRPWFCTLPEEEYLTGSAEVDALVKHDIASGGEWGDRRQELVFIGEKLNIAGLERVLDACLLDDDEYARWTKAMRRGKKLSKEKMEEKLADMFEDGFPDWPEEEEEAGHEGHDHSHGHSHGEKKHLITKQGVAR